MKDGNESEKILSPEAIGALKNLIEHVDIETHPQAITAFEETAKYTIEDLAEKSVEIHDETFDAGFDAGHKEGFRAGAELGIKLGRYEVIKALFIDDVDEDRLLELTEATVEFLEEIE